MSHHAAYRAAGQAVAALWYGAPIAYADLGGAVIRWPGLPALRYRERGQVLAEIAITMAGTLGYFLLPVSPLPQVEFPTIQVQASLPGASPETMASAVATPLERQFGNIAGITEMTSISNLGNPPGRCSPSCLQGSRNADDPMMALALLLSMM